MKSVILILTLFGVTFAYGQSESRVEKKYERYENGELKEDKHYLEKNGKVIAGEDFDTPEFEEIQAKMDAKKLEMDQRMQEMQSKADQMMQKAQQRMDVRMNEMRQRMQKMQNEMDLRMQQQAPAESPQMIPPMQNSAPNSLGATFQT